MISKSGMLSIPLLDGDGKLSGKIECMSWNDYKKYSRFKWDKKYTFIQDNTVKIIAGNVVTLSDDIKK
jgi:hypothetical protein